MRLSIDLLNEIVNLVAETFWLINIIFITTVYAYNW